MPASNNEAVEIIFNNVLRCIIIIIQDVEKSSGITYGHATVIITVLN